MTGHDRIMMTLEGRKASQVPMMLHSFMAAAAEKKISMADYRCSAANIADTHIDFARKYGLDGILVDVDTCLEAGAVGVEVDLPENEPARITRGMSGGIDRCIESMEKDRLLKYDRIKIYLESINIMSRKVKGELLIRGNADQGPFSLAMLAVGITDFMMNLVDPEMEEKTLSLIERAYEVHLEFHKLIREAGADITSFGDSSCGPDLISRDMYRKYAYPFHKRLADDLEDRGIKSVIHICGNLDNILGDVIQAGFPAIEADYKTDISRAAGLMKGKTVLFGPIDPSGVFFYGSEEDVARNVNKVLTAFEGQGIVIGAGCALPSGVPETNLKAFANAVRNFG